MFKSNIYFFYMWIHVVFMVAFAARVSLMTGGSGQLSLAKILPSSCGIHTQVNSWVGFPAWKQTLTLCHERIPLWSQRLSVQMVIVNKAGANPTVWPAISFPFWTDTHTDTHTGGLTDPVLCSVCLLDVCFHGNCSNNRQQWWDWAVDDSHLVSPGYRSSFHTNVYFCFWIFFLFNICLFFGLFCILSLHFIIGPEFFLPIFGVKVSSKSRTLLASL